MIRLKVESPPDLVRTSSENSPRPRKISQIVENVKDKFKNFSPIHPGSHNLDQEKALSTLDKTIVRIGDSHPFVKTGLLIFSVAAKIILDPANRDKAVQELGEKVADVCSFVTQKMELSDMLPTKNIICKIADQTRECARFVENYQREKYLGRVGEGLFKDVSGTIERYNAVFDTLMQKYRDHLALGVAINVHDIVVQTHSIEEKLDLSDMTYADGAGVDFTKQCLPGTRTKILSEIMEWASSAEDDVQRVLWLSGVAGMGKSAIAHTIAKWCNDFGVRSSCYTLDRLQADQRDKKIFSTIARDLADRDPEMKRALADAVRDARALKAMPDILQQWQKLLVEPMRMSLIKEPVVIVIDALDESGVETQEHLLRILAGKHRNSDVSRITDLPSNLRFIVTSRPLDDIMDEFKDVPHIKHKSMDETLDSGSAQGDIRVYVSKELPDFQDRQLTDLANRASGLFEWARLACEYIKDPTREQIRMKSYKAVMSSHPPDRQKLLYDTYTVILKGIMPEDEAPHDQHLQKLRSTLLARFRSVMGQILGTAEPSPLAFLNAMRRHFPIREDIFDVGLVVKSMGSLLSGITNPNSPIRPLHASFRDFLTDKSCSGDFFIDLSKVQHDLAFASLRVMEHGLRFNICDLQSSYLPNSEDPGLQGRLQTCISPHLSYSSRFWASHVRAAVFDKELAKEVRLFFSHERLFFWLELLALINALNGAVPALTLILQWLKDHPEFEDISSTAKDVQKFIQVFGGVILHSTPHLYLSALPFSPANSPLLRQFSARFPNTFRVASGRDMNWPAVQIVIKGHTDSVTSVSFSPDSTHIVTCSWDETVQLWDTTTAKPVGDPLQKCAGPVFSTSFSLDGKYIAAGSDDGTVWLWNAATRESVGGPLRGHTDSVNSVSFSPDSIYILTGSSDKTARLWNIQKGQQDGEPLQHNASVSSVSFSRGGTWIVTGSKDNHVQLWDAATRKPVGEPLKGHIDEVTSVSVSWDSTCIVTGSRDKTARLWNVEKRQQVGEPLRHTDEVTSVSFSPDGTLIATGSSDTTVWLWNVEKGEQVGEPLRGHEASVSSVSFSPDGTRIATGSLDHTVRLWDAVMGQPSQQYAASDHPVVSDDHPTIEATTTVTSNTQNNQSTSFSSNSYALRPTPELIQGTNLDDRSPVPLILNGDSGWVIGPKDRLLFWVPPASRHSFKSAKLDLSRMAHGQDWQKCREIP